MNFTKLLLAAVMIICANSPKLFAQEEKSEQKDETKDKVQVPIKPYSDVITSKAISQTGMFGVHKVGEKYFFEIPQNLIGREILIVVRTVKTGSGAGYGGESIAEVMYRWDVADNGKKVYLRKPYEYTVVDKQSDIYESFKNSYVEPIHHAFDIKAFGRDSSMVIDVTDMYGKDNFTFGLGSQKKGSLGIGAQDDDKSFIHYIKAFDNNIECRSQKTYKRTGRGAMGGNEIVTFEVNHSMLLLPAKPMMPRLADERIGFFTQGQTDFSYDYFRIKQTSYIKRWKLEPKDPEAFRRGELVEPVKPIVFYIDPATPKKLVKYFKQGIEDWQIAFEQAGFKNAILAKEVPSKTEDPNWDAMDSRYSMVCYLASEELNAYGPHVADPRSGEIIEAHVCIYHNLMKLVADWYRIQTAAANPDARALTLSDETMGKLFQQVISHEVGHSLGLAHNFAASNAIPIDSLRSVAYTDKYGTTMSIMDYARYNYVAQEGDGVKQFIPKIGPYDKYVISWGYRPILDATTPQQEQPTLDKWIAEKVGDKQYLYVKHNLAQLDPRGQTEDLGDDAVKAGTLGLNNMKYIVANFDKWLYEPYENFNEIKDFYDEIISQWRRYMRHANCYVGGQYETYKHQNQSGACYEPVEKAKQKEALEFLCQNALDFPEWLIRRDLMKQFDPSGVYERNLRSLPSAVLSELISSAALHRMIEASENDKNAYGPGELMKDVRVFIYRNASKGKKMDMTERSLQKTYIDRLKNIAPKDISEEKKTAPGGNILNMNDIPAIAWNELDILKNDISKWIAKYPKGSIDRAHLQIQLENIKKLLSND